MTELLIGPNITLVAERPEDEQCQNPAILYLMGLSSIGSRVTMRSNLSSIARDLWSRDIEDAPWEKLRPEHLFAIREKLNSLHRAPATINTHLAALKGVAHAAWALGQIDTHLLQRIKDVKSQRGSRIAKGRALTPVEIQQLFDVCKRDSSAKGVRDLAILSILIGCGLRRAELVALTLSDFESKSGYLRVVGKGDKERLAFLPKSTAMHLTCWIDDVRGDYPGPLFTRIRRHDDITEQRMTAQAVYNIVENRRLEASLKLFAPHDLRRTFASMLLANGEDMSTVKDAMGHASLTTTQRYDKRGNKRLQQASQRMLF